MKNIITIFGFIFSLYSYAAGIKRSYIPRCPLTDTVCGDDENYFNHDYFDDDEIINVHFQHFFNDEKNDDGRFVIQQIDKHECTGACVRMFLSDYHQKRIKYIESPEIVQRFEKGRTIDEVAGWLYKNKMIVEKHEIPPGIEGFLMLKDVVDNKGSVIFFAKGKEDPTAHSIIVDEISKNLDWVRLRDPYHGWDITVKGNAFERKISGMSALSFDSMIKEKKKNSIWNKIFTRKNKNQNIECMLDGLK